METFEITPDQTRGAYNPYRIIVSRDETYGQVSDGYVEFRGQAIIIPPVNRISEEYLQDISDETGVQIDFIGSTAEATHLVFTAEYEEDDKGDQEVVEAFKKVLSKLGRTASKSVKK